jgi:hypothetical protein
METTKQIVSGAVEIVYEDGRQETVLVRRLRNTDWQKWVVNLRFDTDFLFLRSIERPDPNAKVTLDWLNEIPRESFARLGTAVLELNGADAETKKVVAATNALLLGFLSTMQSSSSSVAAPTPTS